MAQKVRTVSLKICAHASSVYTAIWNQLRKTRLSFQTKLNRRKISNPPTSSIPSPFDIRQTGNEVQICQIIIFKKQLSTKAFA